MATVFGETSDVAQSAVFGRNDSTSAPSGGGVQGAGVFGLTMSPGAAGVFGANNSAKGVGVQGNGPEAGLSGFSDQGAGVRGHSNHANAIQGFAHDPNGNAVLAVNDATTPSTATDRAPHGAGILAVTNVPGAAGVFGSNNSSKGVGVQGNGPEAGLSGFSDQGAGVSAHSNDANAIQSFAHDPNGNAVLAVNDATTPSTATDGEPHGAGILAVTNVPGAAGVFGSNNGSKGVGVQGNGPKSASGSQSVGVGGFSDAGFGMLAQSNTGSGIVATSDGGQALSASSKNDVGIFAQGATWAAVFNGRLVVNPSPTAKDPGANPPPDGSIVITGGSLFVNKGDVILGNADCAEDFEIAGSPQVEPGTVMVLECDGGLRESSAPYDKRVAGVISGAGSYKPGLVLDRRAGEEGRLPVALMGKVYCKVDARYGQIEVGDLLTTSPTCGHAMKANDPLRAFGAVIGKALCPMDSGQGLIPILVALQ
ncbi:MAG TPA: hypothetical protein VGS20_02205 [Candidatus Acidoferrales bacterium]|nr:hypothetical protein [Candidatus Acidoferrales bacterium]